MKKLPKAITLKKKQFSCEIPWKTLEKDVGTVCFNEKSGYDWKHST